MRFVLVATDQVGVFVRFEIGHTNNNGLWREGSSDCADTFGQFLDKELDRVAVAGHLFIHGRSRVFVEFVVLEQCLRMHAYHAIDDELEAREADTCD